MMKYCKRCNSDIKIPDFTKVQKIELWKQKDKKVLLTKTIMEYGNLTLIDAKALMVHFNEKYGQCIRCSKSDLEGENVECPKCKSFNLNWNPESLT